MSAPSHIVAAAAIAMPSDDKIAALRKKAQELYEVSARIERGEALLKELGARKLAIEMQELPALFEQAGMDKIGLPDAGENGADVVVGPHFKASISSEWEQEKQNEAFQFLEDTGNGGLIKVTVSVEFGKGEIDKARELQEIIRKSPIGNTHPVSVSMGVHWGTLTSWLKEAWANQSRGYDIPLEKIGAIVGQVAKIKQRKAKA